MSEELIMDEYRIGLEATLQTLRPDFTSQLQLRLTSRWFILS